MKLGIQTQQPFQALPFIRETQCELVKVIASEFLESDAKAIIVAHPAHTVEIAWRCYWQGQPAPTLQTAQQLAEVYAARILASPAVQAGLVDYVEAHSEGFNYGYGIDGPAWDAYFVRMCELLEPHGLKVIVGCFGTGNGDAGWWLSTLPQTCRRATYFGFQEYGWPTMDAQAPYHALRHREIINAIRTVNPRAIPCIVECGITQLVSGESGAKDVGYKAVPLTPAQMVEEMRWYHAHADPAAIIIWYGVQMYDDWKTFELDEPEIRAAWPTFSSPPDAPSVDSDVVPIGGEQMVTQEQIDNALNVVYGTAVNLSIIEKAMLEDTTGTSLSKQVFDAFFVLKEAARPLP